MTLSPPEPDLSVPASTPSRPPDGPPDDIRFRRSFDFATAVTELWHARPLIRSLAERDLRARYKQAVLGFAWALITPFALMAVFVLFFDRVAHVETGGVPYALFSYVGLIPWSFFSTSFSDGGLSLLSNIRLLNKIYCPREVFPIASVCVAAVDSAISVLGLLFLFVIFGFVPTETIVWVPVILLVQVVFTLGATISLSAVVLYFRDLRHALPIVLQVGLFATPVAYGLDTIPADIRPLYCAINPLAPVIDGYRRAILYGQAPQWGLLALGAATSSVLLFVGYRVFKRLEAGFADIA